MSRGSPLYPHGSLPFGSLPQTGKGHEFAPTTDIAPRPEVTFARIIADFIGASAATARLPHAPII